MTHWITALFRGNFNNKPKRKRYHRLTAKEVKQIEAILERNSNIRQYTLAKDFNVSASVISRIATHKHRYSK